METLTLAGIVPRLVPGRPTYVSPTARLGPARGQAASDAAAVSTASTCTPAGQPCADADHYQKAALPEVNKSEPNSIPNPGPPVKPKMAMCGAPQILALRSPAGPPGSHPYSVAQATVGFTPAGP